MLPGMTSPAGRTRVTSVGRLLSGLTPSCAISASRAITDSFVGNFYEGTDLAVTRLNDQSGAGRNLPLAGASAAVGIGYPVSGFARPCFDMTANVSQYFQSVAAANQFMSTSAGYVAMSIYLEAVTTDTAVTYLNEACWADSNQFVGLHFRANSGGKALAYNWDTNVDASPSIAGADCAVGQNHVLEWLHVDGNVQLVVDGNIQAAVPSGVTGGGLTGTMRLGASKTDYNRCGIYEFASFAVIPSLAERAALRTAMGAYIGLVI